MMAGFVLRFVAYLIDAIIISFATLIPLSITYKVLYLVGGGAEEGPSKYAPLIIFAIPIIRLIYYSLFESSKFQATPGKLALKLQVTDYDGERISPSRAIIRNLFKLLSLMIFYIGYLMILWMEDQQGLHDIIGKTLVIKNE
jgi:uncharacterized RDD family membrane protein YckC